MSTKMPWFRMYTDFLNDPKMIALAFEDQRHFIGILALKSDAALDAVVEESLMDRIVAQRLWIDHGIIREVKKRLIAAGLIDAGWQPLAWDKRQFKSDNSKDRVARFRARSKDENIGFEDGNDDETLQKRPSNAVETETETETDKEEAKASMSPAKLPTCPHEILIDLFGKHLPTMPQPKKELWSGKNESAMRARWKWVMTAVKKNGTRYASTREEAIDWFERYFAYIQKCDFLTGRAGGWDKCDLGWLVKADNFAKVLQGNYENKEAA